MTGTQARPHNVALPTIHCHPARLRLAILHRARSDASFDRRRWR